MSRLRKHEVGQQHLPPGKEVTRAGSGWGTERLGGGSRLGAGSCRSLGLGALSIEVLWEVLLLEDTERAGYRLSCRESSPLGAGKGLDGLINKPGLQRAGRRAGLVVTVFHSYHLPSPEACHSHLQDKAEVANWW